MEFPFPIHQLLLKDRINTAVGEILRFKTVMQVVVSTKKKLLEKIRINEKVQIS